MGNRYTFFFFFFVVQSGAGGNREKRALFFVVPRSIYSSFTCSSCPPPPQHPHPRDSFICSHLEYIYHVPLVYHVLCVSTHRYLLGYHNNNDDDFESAKITSYRDLRPAK